LLAVTQADPPELALVIDYEKRSGVPSAGTARLLLRNTLEYLKARTDRRIMIYTSLSFWAEFGSTDVYWTQYPLWLAHYTNDAEPRIPKPWETWCFWQYTDKGPGKALGAESYGLDMNLFNGTVADLRTWAGLEPPAPTIEQRVARLEAWAILQGYQG
jgi:lysozyme